MTCTAPLLVLAGLLATDCGNVNLFPQLISGCATIGLSDRSGVINISAEHEEIAGKYTALPTEDLSPLWSGGKDAYGNEVERGISDGNGNPCRHCLRDVPKGAPMLILAYRPFSGLHPYAETGPIFLCGAPCERGGGLTPPDVMGTSPDYLLKGYSSDERIVYGTGAVVPTGDIADQVSRIFANPRVSHIHVRSARNNCYLLRIDQD